MLLCSKLIGAPVADQKSSAKIGEVADFIINDADLSLAAAVVESGIQLISKKRIVAATDFALVSKEGILVANADVLIDLVEVIRIEKLYQKKCHGLNQKVVTKSGAYIGHVFDYLFDTATCQIQKLYIKKMLSERIIPVSAVISYDCKTITIKDDKPYAFTAPTVEAALD